MIRVRVRYCAQANVAAGIAEEEITLDGPCAPADLIVQIASAHGDELRRVLLDADGRPHASVLLFVGEEQTSVNAREPLKDGDVIEILPPISGG